MKVIVDFCIIPLGTELSLTPYIAECQKIIADAGLVHQLHAYGTNIEGEWEGVMDVVKRCHMRVHEMGAPRISTQLKIATRCDREQTMAEKVEHVQDYLAGPRA
ncbi:MTH1187 family thiamine-binding protein [Zhongshania sp.]|uniref:MTH1187 family thiamine-binding protein n=1 Tax=Zhongshania sp. TaxID=1971902 RepID=UPI00356A58C5